MTAAANAYSLREIGRERNEDMRRILAASPVEAGGLAVSFGRDPDVLFLPELFSERVRCAGFFKAERLVGFAVLMRQVRYVDGAPRRVMYFGSAHVTEEGRHRGFLGRASDLLLRGREEWPELGFAVVMRGNRSAEKFIGRGGPGHPGFPHSRVIGTFRAKNVLVLGPRKESRAFVVRRAKPGDVPSIVALLQAEFKGRLFAPVVDTAVFLRNLDKRPGCALADWRVAEAYGRIVGACAAWDMGCLKQTRIVRYGRKLKGLRALHSAVGLFRGFPKLPREGQALRDMTVADWAAENGNPEILEALLRSVYKDCWARRYNMMIVGGSIDDPALRAADRFPGPSVLSNIVMFSKDPALLEKGRIDTSRPYVDLAML
jgi:hypothetical protein